METANELYIGVDLGTTGLRACVVDGTGAVVCSHSVPLQTDRHEASSGLHEQDAEEWLAAAKAALSRATAEAKAARPGCAIAALSVDGTSGTVVAVDETLRPLGPAVMYDDSRSAPCAKELAGVATGIQEKMGYRFSSSFAAPKVLWLIRNKDARSNARWFLAAADFLAAHMAGDGEKTFTDASNALKMGCELPEMRWPDELGACGVPLEKLPPVERSGAHVCNVSEAFGRECGLDPSTRLVAGVTDGTAGFLATGASRSGQMATTVGTTLVTKLLWNRLIRDPKGRIYSHAHPDGGWLPGGASNAGASILLRRFGRDRLEELETHAPPGPTDVLVYPSTTTGERFPFRSPRAEGFVEGKVERDGVLFRACLEGIAFVERLSVEVLEELGASVTSPVCSAGAAAEAELPGKIRASVLDRTVTVSHQPHSAFGSAVLAASSRFGSVEAASRAMIKTQKEFEPVRSWRSAYEETYGRWKESLARRGWLEDG